MVNKHEHVHILIQFETVIFRVGRRAFHLIGKREADSEPEANAEADPFLLYSRFYGYPYGELQSHEKSDVWGQFFWELIFL